MDIFYILGLSILVIVAFYNKAEDKRQSKLKWIAIGAGLFLTISIGGIFLAKEFIYGNMFHLKKNEFIIFVSIISLIFPCLGGLAAYLAYRKLSNLPDEYPGSKDF